MSFLGCNLALKLGVRIRGASLAEGIEVFPKHDELREGEFGNAIRGPLGIHRGANRRYWFYGADYDLQKQISYLNRLRKLSEEQLRTFIAGKTMPPEFDRKRPSADQSAPIVHTSGHEFRILEHVGNVRKVGRNYVTQCPSCAYAGQDRSGDNLAISIEDPRKYICWAGCTKEMIRRAVGYPIPVRQSDKQDSLARRGLTLSRRVLRRLNEGGIFAQSQVSLEHQHLAKRYVVRGIESGGAVKDLGRYVTFCGPDGEPLPYLHPIDALGVNGVHAAVVAPILVRIEVFRAGRTCQLLITNHQPKEVENDRRPPLENSVVFRGVNGFLDVGDLGKEDHLVGSVVPQFWSRGGEKIEMPSVFAAAVAASAKGVKCIGCSHAYLMTGYTMFSASLEHPSRHWSSPGPGSRG